MKRFMQVSLDQILTALLTKVDTIEASMDDLRLKNNILLRLIKEFSPELTKEKLEEVIKAEFATTENAGLIDIETADKTGEMAVKMAESMYNWLEGNVDDIKEKMQEYRKQMEEAMEKERNGNVIDVAPANFVNSLNKNPKKGGNGLIL